MSARRPLTPIVRPNAALPRTAGDVDVADLSAAAIDQFTVAVGGRGALLDTLLVADGTAEVHRVVDFLIDPRYAGWSLRRICALVGLTVADLFAAYKKALIVRAHLQASRVVADNLVAVVDDVMRRSQPHEVTCEACGGLGRTTPEPTKAAPNPEPVPCEPCRATGRLIKAPDLDRQKVALELGQLLQTKGGLTLQQNTLTLATGGGAAVTAIGPIEQLQQAVQAVLHPRPVVVDEADTPPPAPEAIDGEVADAPDDPDAPDTLEPDAGGPP